MSVRLTSQPCRLVASVFLLAVYLTGLPNRAAAATPDRDDDARANHCFEEPEELCGWVELGTHDSAPRLNPNAVVTDAEDAFDAAAGILACAVYAKAGVAVEQMIEPFVMLGPYLENSLDAVKQFQQWWDAAADFDREYEAFASDLIKFDFLRVELAMDRRLDLLAAMEPIDVQIYVDGKGQVDGKGFGPSVLVERFEGFREGPMALRSSVPRRDVLAGCSPMIFTLEETYAAYDLSERDVKLWSVFPTTTRPFCIRNRTSDFDASPMWDQFDQVVQTEPRSSPDSVATQFKCSAYCVLDDWVTRWEEFTADDSRVRQALRPQAIGQRLAGWLAQRDRLAGRAAIVLASQWRQGKPEPRLSPAGAALLARPPEGCPW